MGDDRAEEVRRLLREAAGGDATARNRVFVLVYDELRGIAAAMLRDERTGHTLQTTALVNEAYVRLFGLDTDGKGELEDERHFVRTAARAMRWVLVDHARARTAGKRPDSRSREELPADLARALEHPLDVLAVDEALDLLEREDPRAAELVMLRLFAGLGLERIAEVMELSYSTVRDLFEVSKAFLSKRLAPPEP